MDRGTLTEQGDLNTGNGLWNWPGGAAGGEIIAGAYEGESVAVSEIAKEELRAETSASEMENGGPFSQMTLADFVARKFIPEYVALKGSSGKMHYQAMLKHVLKPEEVNGLFRQKASGRRNKLSAVAGWPYLSAVSLCDVGTEDVQRLVEAALAKGYSTQTATHILNVVSAIFSHAKQVNYLSGNNPVRQVKRWEVIRKAQPPLTLDQVKTAVETMKAPEREMMLMAILTGMNVSEICGLQWKHVNLSDNGVPIDAEPIPPRSIAVRRQWFRGELSVVKKGRARNVQIPAALWPILAALRSRARFTGPDDFVLVSRVGTPVNHANILVRRLKPMAAQIGVPALSWHVFQNTRKSLTAELGRHFQESIGTIVRVSLLRSSPLVSSRAEQAKSC